ncbi:MAG: hypothetical protein RLZZ347_594 [Candidatus Parcubacteria bacterium]|jgi:hypothetical protein
MKLFIMGILRTLICKGSFGGYNDTMPIDWTKIYKKNRGLWVALASDEQTILGVGKTVKEALLEAHKKGNLSPILTRMPESILSYVGVL